MRRLFTSLLLAVCIVFGLVSCGGGGGSSGPTMVQGTVAVGAPLANAEVTVYQINGGNGLVYFIAKGKTDAQGKYSIDVSSIKPPYLVVATTIWPDYKSDFPVLASVSTTAGTINVTLLTHLLVAQLLQKPSGWEGVRIEDIPRLANITAEKISTARQKVVDFLMARPNKNTHSMTTPAMLPGLPTLSPRHLIPSLATRVTMCWKPWPRPCRNMKTYSPLKSSS